MLFNSYLFLFAFLPIALLGAHLLAGRPGGRPALLWLIGTSLVYYGWWSPPLTLMLLGSIAFNFAIGRVLSEPGRSRRKLLLGVGVAGNLLLLGQFKYQNFAIEVWNQVAGTGVPLGPMILPLAISFFTFQQIAYLVDVYRGETKSGDFLRYALFVVFFPQLIAGPIVHHKEMLPQFASPGLGRLDPRNLSVGLTILLIGLFKKVIIADGMAGYADPVFAAANAGTHALSLADAWGGALAYTFQLYFDFSGYSDMAIGLGAMLGVRLPVNFDSPYKATSIIDFWRRWHMTLSRFLRDYLYIPLGGNRRGPARRHVNLMLTMLLGGLWHGAGWNFVLWGGLHGLFLAVNHGFRAARQRLGLAGDRGRAAALSSGALTFLCVVVAWVLFRAGTVEAALSVLGAMAGGSGLSGPALTRLDLVGVPVPLFGADELALAALLCGMLWLLPNTQEFMASASGTAPRAPELRRGLLSAPSWAPSLRWAAFAGAALVLCLLGMTERHEFVYFRF